MGVGALTGLCLPFSRKLPLPARERASAVSSAERAGCGGCSSDEVHMEDAEMSKQPLSGILCLVFFVAFFSAVFLTAQAPINLSGQITGTAGDPKRFVTVQFNGPGSYIALTDDEGKFSIHNLVPGQYTILVRQEERVQRFSITIQSSTLNLVVKW